MSTFDEAYAITLRHEGGYVWSNTEGDRGGRTYGGISEKWWPDWIGFHVEITDDLLQQYHKDFFKQQVWDKLLLDRIDNNALAYLIYDTAVHVGCSRATKLLQQVVCARIDGIIGHRTIASANYRQPVEAVVDLVMARLRFYGDVCRKHPDQKQFLLGWYTRALSFAEE